MLKFSFYPILLFLVMSSCKSNEFADRIYINAKVWTGDSGTANISAIAIKDSLILYVGNDYTQYKGTHTEVIDVGGGMILPGFIDNHTHFLSGGYQLANINLRVAKTKSEFINTIKTFAASIPESRWIQGGDWDHEVWGGQLPQKEWIDSISSKNPVFVSRYDGHMALVNSVTLKLAGITRESKNPAGGEIVRDPATGEPTGILKDEAMSLVYDIVPPLTEQELNESFQRGVKEAHANGVTQVHDMGSYGGWQDLETYQRNRRNLNLRIYSFVPLSQWKELDSFVKKNGKGDDMLHWGAVKGFVDGSLGSTTAWFYKPYKDDPSTSGFTVTDTSLLHKWIRSADSAGLHVAIHAIGDRANDWLLNCFEEMMRNNKGEPQRFRIEHAQHLTAEAIKRFHTLDVIPSMQPYHAIDDGRWAYKRLEEERLKGTYAFKSLLLNNAQLTFGSDWTVAPLSPLLGVYAAVTRKTLDDKNPNGWYPEQKLSLEEALKCYTRNNAYAGFMEAKTGLLKQGFLADVTVLSENLFTIPPEKIKEVKVLRTIVNGKEVYTDNK
jgi:predicted amidohydrolase YtcJ